MKYWLHRITGGDNAWSLGQALFNKGYISIGWCDFSTETCLAIIKGPEAGFDKMFYDKWKAYPRNRWNLWRFVKAMAPGDIVVVPSSYSFTVCRISDEVILTNETIESSLLKDLDGMDISLGEDGYLYYPDGRFVDLGFYRKVEIIEKDISRDKYADQALYSRMKIRQTNADVCDLAESINNAFEAFRKGKPINLKETLLESSVPLVLDKIRNLQNDSKFEALVEWYMKSLGARVDTPWRGESPSEAGDADKVAYFDKLGFAVMIQIKKHSGITDDWAVTQIKAYSVNHNFGEYTTALWVITSGDGFSDDARKLAEDADVRLIDGPAFARMILDAGLSGLVL